MSAPWRPTLRLSLRASFLEKREKWGTPGRYTADVNYRYVFSRARRRPPAPALRFAIGRATRPRYTSTLTWPTRPVGETDILFSAA